MTPGTTDLHCLAARVEKLERQNRRLKQVGTVVLILAAAVLLMGQASPQRTVEANEFVLKDESGVVRGRLFMSGRVPELSLFDANGNRKATLSGYVGGGVLAFDDNDGDESVILGYQNGRGMLSLSAGDGMMAVLDSESVTGGPALFLFPRGEAVTLWDQLEEEHGQLILSVIADEPIIFLQDNEGFATAIGATDLSNPRTGETHKTSAASVVLFDKDKKVLWQAP